MGLDITPLYPEQGDGSNATRIQGDDVSPLQPTDGQTLVYRTATAQYVPETPAGGSVAVGDITGLGTGVATALAVNVGSSGAFITLGGALGTPSSGTLTNCTGYPTATTTTAGVVPNLGGAIPVGAFSVAQATGANRCVWPFTTTVWAQAVTGTGVTSRTDATMFADAGSTATSTALIRSQGQIGMAWPRQVTLNSGSSFLTDYSRTLVWAFSCAIGAQPTNGTVRFSWGKSSADGVGALARHGWEIVVTGSGGTTVTIGAHNGTTLATTTVAAASGFSGYTPHPIVVILRGGTMYFYYGDDALTLDTPTATLAGAPTATTGTQNSPFFQVEVSNGASAAACRADLYQLSTMILK